MNNDPAAERFDVVWKRWAQDQPSIAWRTQAPNAAVRIDTSDGMVSHPARREITGRRSGEGWEVYARSSRPGPAPTWTSWAPVRISSRAASQLDTLLTDPCLWSTPRFLDAEVPLKNGRYDSRPDGPLTAFDVSAGKHQWGGLQISWAVGAPGRLRGLLLTEAFGLPNYPPDEIDPEGWIDKP